MPDDSLFTGIDIGSTGVRIAIGQRLALGDERLQAERGQVHIIGAAEVPAEGISRGVINSIEDVVSCISSCIEKAERMTGSPVVSAWVSISGVHVSMLESKGVVAVSRPDGEIRDDDVDRAVEAAQTMATPVNYEIVHVIPKCFTVDGQPGIKDPVGMNGIRLEVDAQIIQGLSPHIRNLTRCVYRTGIAIERPVLGALASAESVLTSRQKELGVAVANIGGAGTTLLVFEQGDIMHLASLPIGSDHITADLTVGLRTSIDIAEKVKLTYATALARDIGRKDQINLRELGAGSDELVLLRDIAEIVQARAEELFEKIDKELKKIGRSGMLPGGVVLTGGGAKLPGLIELAKEKLRLPVSLGCPIGVSSITDRVSDPGFTTAIGLVQWGMGETPEPERGRGAGFMAAVRPVEKMAKQLSRWFGSRK